MVRLGQARPVQVTQVLGLAGTLVHYIEKAGGHPGGAVSVSAGRGHGN